MDMVKRIGGIYLLVTALAVALLLIITPLIHDGSADYPLWKILNWFMAAGSGGGGGHGVPVQASAGGQ